MRYTLAFSDFGVQLDDLEKDRTIFLDFEAETGGNSKPNRMISGQWKRSTLDY